MSSLAALVLIGCSGHPVTGSAGGPAPTATRAVTVRPQLAGSTRWSPRPGQRWQWILDQPLTRTQMKLAVPVFDIDGFDNPRSTVAALHAMRKRAICYVDVGTWESWRPDARSFPKSLLGRSNGWAGERWLDIRRVSTLAPLLTARFRMCRRKGFDAVEPDNVDGYTNRTGFALTAAAQVRFNLWVAGEVHKLGMGVALKNDLDQVPRLVAAFDFAVDEQCFAYDECAALRPFVRRGKAVLEVEYSARPSRFCPVTSGRYHFASMRKHERLDAYRVPCPR
jgi:hypothetical protein